MKCSFSKMKTHYSNGICNHASLNLYAYAVPVIKRNLSKKKNNLLLSCIIKTLL